MFNRHFLATVFLQKVMISCCKNHKNVCDNFYVFYASVINSCEILMWGNIIYSCVSFKLLMKFCSESDTKIFNYSNCLNQLKFKNMKIKNECPAVGSFPFLEYFIVEQMGQFPPKAIMQCLLKQKW